MQKIYISSELPGNSVDRLRTKYDVLVHSGDRHPSRSEFLFGARGSHALITMVSDSVDEQVIDSCPELKIVSNCGVGFENIDIPYATEKGVFVTNTPDVLTETTADLAWALMFSVARKVIDGDFHVREGRFTCWHPSLLLGMDIHKKTLGIYGMGRIGTAVGKRARGFNMRVLYHNRNRNHEGERDTGATFVDFPTLLEKSDYIVIAAPLNEESDGRFGLDEFKQMKPTSIIVNIARGQIIKEDELAAALDMENIWGAGLDVYENEPMVDKKLKELNNVVLLPHIGSASYETRVRMVDLAVESVESALNGGVPTHLVNTEVK